MVFMPIAVLVGPFVRWGGRVGVPLARRVLRRHASARPVPSVRRRAGAWHLVTDVGLVRAGLVANGLARVAP